MRKIFHRNNFIILIFLSLVFLLVSCGKDKKYACTMGSGITMSCGDMTSYYCDQFNGTWHKGSKCSDYGYKSAQLDDIESAAWSELVFADSSQESPSGTTRQ